MPQNPRAMKSMQEWPTINEETPETTDWTRYMSPNESGVEEDLEDYSVSASKHRAAILATATAIVAHRRIPATKRKSDAAAVRQSKRRKQTLTLNPAKHNKDAVKDEEIDQDLTLKSRHRLSEPMKRYLVPTKQSRLNRFSLDGAKTSPIVVGDCVDHLIASKIKSGLSEVNMDSDIENTTKAEASTLWELFKPRASPFPHYVPGVAEEKMGSDFDAVILSSSDEDSTGLLTPLISPQNSQPTQNARLLSIPLQQPQPVLSDLFGAPKPFLRFNHEDSLPHLKYSPIPRLVPGLRIQTCFRVAEALRLLKPQPTQDTRDPAGTIELFAVVTNVTTRNGIQTFKFADVFFPNNPPYIEGLGHGPSALLNLSAKCNLSQSINLMCRAMIRSDAVLSPNPTHRNTVHNAASLVVQRVDVLAIRPSTWVELEYVRGIVDSEGVELERAKRNAA